MIKTLQQSYDGNNLNQATAGIMHFLLEENCTIKALSIVTDANVTGDLVFNISKNGAELFSGAGRPTIVAGTEVGELTGLNIAGLKYDKMLVNLDSIAAGIADTPITLILLVDDGIAAGGGGSSYEEITLTNKVGVTTTAGITAKNLGNGWGDAGAFSVESISDIGEFMLILGDTPTTNYAFMAGPSRVEVNQDYTSIERAINFSDTTQVYENGAGADSAGATAIGDVFIWKFIRDTLGVRRFLYIKNGSVFRRTSVPEGDYHFDIAFYGVMSKIGKIYIKQGF